MRSAFAISLFQSTGNTKSVIVFFCAQYSFVRRVVMKKKNILKVKTLFTLVFCLSGNPYSIPNWFGCWFVFRLCQNFSIQFLEIPKSFPLTSISNVICKIEKCIFDKVNQTDRTINVFFFCWMEENEAKLKWNQPASHVFFFFDCVILVFSAFQLPTFTVIINEEKTVEC